MYRNSSGLVDPELHVLQDTSMTKDIVALNGNGQGPNGGIESNGGSESTTPYQTRYSLRNKKTK